MSTSGTTQASSVDPLIRQLVERIDRDKNGQITTAEFGDFLTSLLRPHAGSEPIKPAPTPATTGQIGHTGSDGYTGHVGYAAPPVPDPPSTDPTDEADPFPPSSWTDNNAPYGVTLAGFSPQDHTHLTLADLGIPGRAEKYAVYHYLVTNRVQPTHDWAPAAAEALNRKYNTTVYHAIDGETLGYGNQYVHSAPNGYGMLPGTYNPHATGEFFWGAV